MVEIFDYYWNDNVFYFLNLHFSLGIVFLTTVDRMKYEIHKTHQILLIERMNPFLFCRKITIIKDLE